MGPKKKSKLRRIEQLNKTLGRPVKAVVKQKRDPSKICQLGNKKKSLERRLEELHKSLGRLAEAWGIGETMLGKDQDCTKMRTRQQAKAESHSRIKDFLRMNKNTETLQLYDNQQHLQTAYDLTRSPGEYSSWIQVKQEPFEQPSADQLEFYPYVPVQDEDTERDYNSSIKQECLDDSDIYWCDPPVGTSGGSYWNQEDNQRMEDLDQVSSVDQVPIKEESEDDNYDANSFVDDNTSELLNRSPQIEAGYLRSGLVEFVSLDNLASTSSTCQISNATLKIPQFIQGQEIGSHSHLVHQSEREFTNQFKKMFLKCKEDDKHIQLVLYIIFIGIAFILHKFFLLQAHRQVLVTYIPEETSLSDILIDGIPSIAPVVLIVLMTLLLMFMACCKSKCADERRQRNFILILGMTVLLFGCAGTIVQVALVIYKDFLLFLEVRAANLAECFCCNNYTNAEVGDFYWCRCNVPGEEFPIGFSIRDANLLTIDVLNEFLEKREYEGTEVEITITNTTAQVIQKTDNEFEAMQMLSSMAELSIVFVVLRLPMFVLMKGMKLKRKIIKQESQESTDIRMELQLYFSNDIEAFLEIVIFAFVESLDAYSLLGDIIQQRYIFAGNTPLTYTVFALVLTNAIVVNGSSIIVFLSHMEADDQHQKYIRGAAKVAKLMVVILNNLPFMALRSYLLYVNKGLKNLSVGSVYVIFILKEVVLFVLGVTEFSLESKKEKSKSDRGGSEQKKNKHPPSTGVGKISMESKQLEKKKRPSSTDLGEMYIKSKQEKKKRPSSTDLGEISMEKKEESEMGKQEKKEHPSSTGLGSHTGSLSSMNTGETSISLSHDRFSITL